MNIPGFLIAGLVALAVPGPDVALVVHTTVTRGRRHGIGAAFGIGAGLLVHSLLALIGLSAVIYASATAYGVVRALGATYLIFLGGLAFRDASARHDPAFPIDGEPVEPHATYGPGRSVRKGFLTNLLNAKAILFFIAFLPLFAGTGPGTARRIFILGVIQALLAVTYFCCITFGVHAARRFLERRRTRQVLDVVTGVVFCGFGIELLVSFLV